MENRFSATAPVIYNVKENRFSATAPVIYNVMENRFSATAPAAGGLERKNEAGA